jgi:hypothetical protein
MSEAGTCRISAISDDWASKGCHVHVGRIEVAIRPDHLGRVAFKKVFSSTPDGDLLKAVSIVKLSLGDDGFRTRLRSAIERAKLHMPSVEGYWEAKARGRLLEFKFLLLALDRMEGSR